MSIKAIASAYKSQENEVEACGIGCCCLEMLWELEYCILMGALKNAKEAGRSVTTDEDMLCAIQCFAKQIIEKPSEE